MWNPSLLVIFPLLWSGADLSTRPPDVLRSRVSGLEATELTGETLRLELFEDESIEAVRDRLVPTGSDGFTWIGRALGDEESSVVLSVFRGVLSASLRLASGQYRIRREGAGLHRIEEVAPSSEPPERQPLPAGRASRPPAAIDLDDGTELDLLVIYTPRARRAAGGADAIASLVGLGLAETNLALEKSEVLTRLRLVELREVSFAEAGRVESDLEILREENDGALDEVHELRDAYGADVVQLVVEEGDGCGIAYSMGRAGASFSEWAYAVVERSCIDTTYAMTHELGHNLGCDHAPEDSTTKGAFAYSFGYKDPLAGFRTIMAYGPGRRVARFSNPRVLFGGVPAGTEWQDNARSLNELRVTASRFRRSLPPPSVTSDLGATGTLQGTTRFRVSSDGPRVREWRLFLGTSPGASDVLDSGPRSDVDYIDAPLSSLEGALFGRLWYRRGAVWLHEDFLLASPRYTAPGVRVGIQRIEFSPPR
jgi:hypothetical protein